MTLLVHLTSATNAAAIRRSGLRIPRTSRAKQGIFAFPVVPNFVATHQWLRELKRRGAKTICGVYFRVPDSEPILFGHYRNASVKIPAAEAAGIIRRDPNPLGYECVITRAVPPKAIIRIRSLPQLIGWRYYPEAKGRKPCGCPSCQRGDIKSRRIREAFEDAV